ncbi:hypothetical protein DFP72DRAFT_821322 [Ephemerocybe angulata]|uniref:HMG domain-containing protein n=1 Tax=Ephemerocybe angulata TaxID=980116 RepID=A0A8H6HK14_9AGAR|nr:hypothetical protein DFP72DRAFT_821322 [Tulosesus angulatus]
MPRKATKRKTLESSDEEEGHAFPGALLASVNDHLWTSPVKAQRSAGPHKRAPKTSGRTKGQRERGAMAVQTAGADFVLGSADALDDVDADFEDYADAVASHVAGYYHIPGDLFVVQGWDSGRSRSTNAWYHLRYQRSDDDGWDTGCTCPKALNKNLCVHRRYFKEYEVESLIPQSSSEVIEDADVLQRCFFRRMIGSYHIESLFSVMSMSSSELKGRAIVTNELSRRGIEWKCSKDIGLLSCFHIRTVQEEYPGISSLDASNDLDDIGDSSSDSISVGDLGSTVSYLPIHVPLWSRLPSDQKLYEEPPPMRTPHAGYLFTLDADSTCACRSGRTRFDPNGDKNVRDSKLYTILQVYTVQMEVQPCPVCPKARRRSIGPDLRTHGIFNYNNSILVSHELLDEYTSSFTSSETPFTGWYTQLSRRYSLSGSHFMGDDLFRAVWFAYVSLQNFDNDMSCTVCGPTPDTVIWDGITLAFGRKHVQGSLRPPTVTTPESVNRPNVVSRPHQQLLVDRSLRKNIRSTLHPPSKDSLDDELPTDSSSKNAKSPSKTTKLTETQLRRVALSVKDHLERVDSVSSDLGKLSQELGQLYLENYGSAAYASGRMVTPSLKNLFVQVAAEESVLQLVNYSALVNLQKFLTKPTPDMVYLLRPIPAFYKAIAQNKGEWNLLVGIMGWVETNTRRVLKELIVEGTLPVADPTTISNDSREWIKTGCYYSMPIVRHRPVYSNLDWERRRKEATGQRGDRCGKYYSQYGERRLTGGIMVCWCSHSICYGFHCIPKSEGRDDVPRPFMESGTFRGGKSAKQFPEIKQRDFDGTWLPRPKLQVPVLPFLFFMGFNAIRTKKCSFYTV